VKRCTAAIAADLRARLGGRAAGIYQRLGVPGVKTGYAGDTTVNDVKHNHYDQVMVNH
jgi:hypothetical protein